MSALANRFSLFKRIEWILLSLLSALLLNLAFPYPGYSLFAWICLVPFFIVIMTQTLKRVFLGAIITGIAFNVVYLIWMKEYKHPATLSGGVFLQLLYFLFAAFLFWMLRRLLDDFRSQDGRRSPKSPGFLREPRSLGIMVISALLCTTAWLLVDYLKTIGYLAFPWGILGYSQYKNLLLIQSARLFGVWGIDFVLLFSNVTIASLLVELRETGRWRGSRGNLMLLACAVLLILLFGARELEVEKKQELRKARIALIQGNLDPWSPQLTENIQVGIELTRMAMEQDPDLVVWSESSVPFPYEYYLARGEKHALRIQQFAQSLGRPLLFGSIEFDGILENGEYSGDFYNVAILYRKGRLADVYRKIHLVPFGEWFPYERLFPFVSLILEKAGAGDFTPGTEYVVFDMEGFTASVLICFEDVFGNLTRMFIPHNPELFINVTNDAWTGSEKAEVQHFSISVFRTVETRRSLVRAANGGVTVCVNPYGRIIDSLPLFTSDYLVCDVPLQEGNMTTLYVRWGDFFPKWLGVIFLAFLLALGVKKVIDRKKKKNIM